MNRLDLTADISPNHEKIAIGTTTKKLKIFSTRDGKTLNTVDKHLDWVTAVRSAQMANILHRQIAMGASMFVKQTRLVLCLI